MHNRLELVRRHDPFVFGFSNLGLVDMVKDTGR